MAEGLFVKDLPTIRMTAKEHSDVLKHLSGLRKERLFCDVTLQCSGGCVYGHKCVLASASPYFKAVLTSPLSCASPDVVALEDFSVEAVTLLMDAVYSQVDVPAEHGVELLRLVEYVQLDWLVEALVKQIKKQVCKSNVLSWYAVANNCGISKLKSFCESIIGKLQAEESPNQHRNVILMKADKFGQSVCVIDPTYDTCKIYDGETKIAHFFGEDMDILHSFTYEKRFYILTVRGKRNAARYAVHKFDNASKTFSTVFRWKWSDITREIEVPSVRRISKFFDERPPLFCYHEGHLYMVYEAMLQIGRHQYFIFKFKLSNFAFSRGYIMMDEAITHMSFYKEDGQIYLVTPKFIYDLEKHNFDSNEHSDVLCRLDLNRCVVATDVRLTVDNQDWYCPCSTDNGSYFATTGFDFNVDQYHILKLDIESRSWVHILKFTACFHKLYHCESSLFLQCVSDYEDLVPAAVLCLDEEEKALKPAKWRVPHVTRPFGDYVVIPHHILF